MDLWVNDGFRILVLYVDDSTDYHHITTGILGCCTHCFFFLFFFFLFTIPVPILFSGEALDCGRYISSLPCSSASRWRNVSPRVYSNECVVFHMNGSWDLYPSFFFPGLQTFTSVWMKGSVSSPVQSPLPLWDVWVQWNVN